KVFFKEKFDLFSAMPSRRRRGQKSKIATPLKRRAELHDKRLETTEGVSYEGSCIIAAALLFDGLDKISLVRVVLSYLNGFTFKLDDFNTFKLNFCYSLALGWYYIHDGRYTVHFPRRLEQKARKIACPGVAKLPPRQEVKSKNLNLLAWNPKDHEREVEGRSKRKVYGTDKRRKKQSHGLSLRSRANKQLQQPIENEWDDVVWNKSHGRHYSSYYDSDDDYYHEPPSPL